MEQERPLILAVDDEITNLKLVQKALRNQYRLVPAKNGNEALEKIRAHNPQVVLLDLQMPEMDGWQVLDELKKSGELNSLRIIVVSAEEEGVAKAYALSMGVRDYVTKPFDTAELLARIQMTLGSRTDAEFSRDIERHVDAAIAGVQRFFDDIIKEVRDFDTRDKVQEHLQGAEDFFRSFMLWEKLQRAPLSLKETISPAEILNDLIINSYPPKAISFRMADHEDSRMLGDASWLRIMLNSTIRYARTKSSGEVPLRVELAGEDDKLLIAIAYQGKPIPPDHVPYVFTPFPDGVGEEVRPEVDMRLAIAATITYRHNGTITHRQDGRWTTFAAVFPRAIMPETPVKGDVCHD